MDECPSPTVTTPPHQPPTIRYLAGYDPVSRDFCVYDQVRNIVVDHLPDLLQCDELIQQLRRAEGSTP